MRLNFVTSILVTFISSYSFAWSVGGVSCRKPDLSDPTKIVGVYFEGSKLTRASYAKDPTGGEPKPAPSASDLEGTFANRTKINPHTVWWGVFDFITVYDGLVLENGSFRTRDGQGKEVKADIRFKPFTDLAYGPDYAFVTLTTKNPGDSQWTTEFFDKCYVSVTH